MKLKALLFITPLLTLSTSLFAKNILTDSIGIENHDGKKVILHKLDPKDNYYSIGRRYNVRPGDIIKFNNNAPLKIGDVIKVPTDRSFLEVTKPTVVQQNKPAVVPQTKPAVTPPPVVNQQQPPVQQQQQPATNNQPSATGSGIVTQDYKVSAGETLYSIAKRFSSTVEDITKLNGLTSTTVTPGQIIKVQSGTADAAPPAPENTVAKRDSTSYVSASDSIAERKFNANKFGLYEKDEKGVATWIDDASLDPNKKLVLHRTAPIGTVIKITNPMTNRTTFAKVVGHITDNESTKDVILVMTKNVAESIGGLDKRIHVNISYGSPNE
ncbi:LysM peptidoglycan-binding domain-containing protein [Mucilaginibacter corticis]|uniref:LysM peptidoglycan-binding domain-containing protein n=1 Tax=Mucilaginibacter corticis TaxID=2597670 RepID=A0A556MBC1_9SPHI|nr:LysM peptidoglycan-binding domain-containing protein [Mucilaginibacter corticis]TSJ37200.1 LysM peptidoglycan-binding domain-containing protein [Mucilaginibacter corticis]